MKKNILIPLFALVVLVQWYVPGSIILTHENALSKGEALKFRTGLYDPLDPFRGRYVRLNFEWGRFDGVSLSEEKWPHYGVRQAYVLLEKDEDGFAKVTALSLERPQNGSYLRAKVRHWGSNSYFIELPFDRYFMNEKAAPEAERLYLQANRRGRSAEEAFNNDNYVLVRVFQGTAAIESLYVFGQPIEALLKGNAEGL